MVKCFSAFLDFCFIARRNAISAEDLDTLRDSLHRFHHSRNVFIETGVRTDISLPRQHSLIHYFRSIRLFGSPNGLCSSITESKHIKAVKKPWRRLNRFRALVQMLRTISRLDKLEALRCVFAKQGMMEGSTSSYTEKFLRGEQPQPLSDLDGDDEDRDLGPVSGPKVHSSIELAKTPGAFFRLLYHFHVIVYSFCVARGYPHDVADLAEFINQPRFPEVLRRFLWEQLQPDSLIPPQDVPLDECPHFHGRINVFHSAIAHFYAPSDLCGTGGMYREQIRLKPNWHGEYARYDTVFVETDAELPGMLGMFIARVLLLFSFSFHDQDYSCALIHWFIPVGDGPDNETRMWAVRPEYEGSHRSLSIIHLDCIARGAHLLPVFGSSFLPEDFHFSDSLHTFRAYFVNKHADHQIFELLSAL